MSKILERIVEITDSSEDEFSIEIILDYSGEEAYLKLDPIVDDISPDGINQEQLVNYYNEHNETPVDNSGTSIMLMWNDIEELCLELESEEENKKLCKESVEHSYNEGLLDDYDDKEIAVGIHIETDINGLKEISNNYHNTFDTPEGEYYCADEGEMESDLDDYLDNYIDECVLSEVPENFRDYFDTEKFKSDCEMDGWSHYLGIYDGCGYEVKVNNETYYICRTN